MWLIQDFDLLSVLLRALTLSLEAVSVGGILLLLFVATARVAELEARIAVRRFTGWFALALAITQALAAAESTIMLMGASGPGIQGLPFHEVLAASFFRADCALSVSAVALFFLLRYRRS